MPPPPPIHLQKPITIIGAGLSGLTLARTLKHYNLPSTIYERTPNPPPHNYGITLHHHAYAPLLPILNLSAESLRQRVGITIDSGGGSIDPFAFSCSKQIIGSGSSRDGGSSFRAHRGRLERLLREGLDVRFGHEVSAVEVPPHFSGSGKGRANVGVKLSFGNGVEVVSDFVVACDGVHSAVRKCVNPDNFKPDVLDYFVVRGKRRVKKEVFENVYAEGLKERGIVEVKMEGVVLRVMVDGDVSSLEEGKEVDISWTYSRKGKLSDKGLLNRETSQAGKIPDYFYEEIKALERVGLEQPFKDVFVEEKVRGDRVLHWLMRTVLIDLERLRWYLGKSLFFLGDAVHAEPILGGEGANAALSDGVEAGELIAKRGKESLEKWVEERYAPCWQQGIEKSVKTVREMHEGGSNDL